MKKIALPLLFVVLMAAVYWVSKKKVTMENAEPESAAPVAASEPAVEADKASSESAPQGETTTPATSDDTAPPAPATAADARPASADNPPASTDTLTFDQVNQCLGKRMAGASSCVQTVASDLLNFVVEHQNSYRFTVSPEVESEQKKAQDKLVKDCKLPEPEAERLLKLDLSGC
jgi:hypothetical protein